MFSNSDGNVNLDDRMIDVRIIIKHLWNDLKKLLPVRLSRNSLIQSNNLFGKVYFFQFNFFNSNVIYELIVARSIQNRILAI